MALQLKQAITAQFIIERQNQLALIVSEKLSKVSNLFMLGPQHGPRGNSVAFVIQHSITGEMNKLRYIFVL